MKKYFIFIGLIISFVFISCKKNDVSEEISNLIKKEGYSERVVEKILDDEKYPATTKTSYSQKVTVLIKKKQEYMKALRLAEKCRHKYPEYMEMNVTYCVLSKYCLDVKVANNTYKKLTSELEKKESLTTDEHELFNILSSHLVLSVLFGDVNMKEKCEEKIKRLKIYEQQKFLIDYILTSDEAKIFEMFGIR